MGFRKRVEAAEMGFRRRSCHYTSVAVHIPCPSSALIGICRAGKVLIATTWENLFLDTEAGPVASSTIAHGQCWRW